MSEPTAVPHVFLSYASSDRERVAAIADALEQTGVRVWADRPSIVGGTAWDAEIVRGIEGWTVVGTRSRWETTP